MDISSDLEYGVVTFSKRVQFLIKNKHKLKNFIVAFLILSIALVIKFAFYNIDNVIESASVVTLDEDVYKPFKLTKEIILDVGDKATIQFPTKNSQINWKIQALNIAQGRAQVLDYINKVGFVCLHMRHFGVQYDIIVFKNVTMVNPVVVDESEEKIMRQEETLSGKKSRKKRPIWIKIKYKDESLIDQVITLWNNQAACFAHYEF